MSMMLISSGFQPEQLIGKKYIGKELGEKTGSTDWQGAKTRAKGHHLRCAISENGSKAETGTTAKMHLTPSKSKVVNRKVQ